MHRMKMELDIVVRRIRNMLHIYTSRFVAQFVSKFGGCQDLRKFGCLQSSDASRHTTFHWLSDKVWVWCKHRFDPHKFTNNPHTISGTTFKPSSQYPRLLQQQDLPNQPVLDCHKAFHMIFMLSCTVYEQLRVGCCKDTSSKYHTV